MGEYSDYFISFEEPTTSKVTGKSVLFARKDYDHERSKYEYEPIPFLKRITDYLEFEPRLLGIVN